MVGTGYTDTSLLLGHTLKDVVMLVIQDLNANIDLLGYEAIDYDAEDDYYSPYFYHLTWNALIRPTIAKYLIVAFPNAWFLPYYTLHLKPN